MEIRPVCSQNPMKRKYIWCAKFRVQQSWSNFMHYCTLNYRGFGSDVRIGKMNSKRFQIKFTNANRVFAKYNPSLCLISLDRRLIFLAFVDVVSIGDLTCVKHVDISTCLCHDKINQIVLGLCHYELLVKQASCTTVETHKIFCPVSARGFLSRLYFFPSYYMMTL